MIFVMSLVSPQNLRLGITDTVTKKLLPKSTVSWFSPVKGYIENNIPIMATFLIHEKIIYRIQRKKTCLTLIPLNESGFLYPIRGLAPYIR